MNVAGAVGEVLPRSRARVLWQAALLLWLPTSVPLLTGMLSDCGHCVSTYLLLLPLVPGVIVPGLARLDGAWFALAAVPPTLLLGTVLYVVGREAPTWVRWLAGGVVAAAVTAQAIGFAHALRA